jgi:hypothetical protein
MNLLGELTYVFKDHTVTHYALLDATQITRVEVERLRSDYGIEVIAYTPSAPDHPEFTLFLEQLSQMCPRPFQKHIEKAKQELENLDPHFRIVPNTKGEFAIEEKYPGAADEGNLDFRMTINREAFEAWQRFQETGEAITIPGEQVESFVPPEIIRKAFGGEFKPSEVTFGGVVNQEKKKVRLRIVPKGGTAVAIDHIELGVVSAGSKKIVLSNAGQEYFLKLTLNMSLDDNLINVDMVGTYVGVNVAQSWSLNNFFEAVEKGGELIIEYSDTGGRLGSTMIAPDLFHPQSKSWKSIVGALVEIQEKTGASFITPERIATAEVATIFDTAKAIIGHVVGTLTIESTISRVAAQKLVTENATVQVIQTADYRPIILGTEVNIGSVWTLGTDMMLKQGEQVRLKQFLDRNPDATEVTCTLVSQPDNGHAYYLDFLDDESFEELAKNIAFRKSSLNNLVALIIDSALIEGALNIEAAVATFRVAKDQNNKFQRPYNMLGRADKDELRETFAPQFQRLRAKDRDDLIAALVDGGVFDADELASTKAENDRPSEAKDLEISLAE